MGFLNKLKGTIPTGADFELRDRAMRVHQNGVPATGTLIALEKTGREDFGGGIEYRFTVQVTPDGGTPYETTFHQSMLAGMMGDWAQPGRAVSLKVDPQDPSAAILMGGA